MTAEFVFYHAHERPDAVAIIDDGHAISYAQLSADIARFTAALEEFELREHATVVVQCREPYAHWLLLLAGERLGLVTASIGLREGPEVLPLLEAADLVLAEQPLPPGSRRLSQPVTPDWLADLFARPAPRDAMPAPKQPDDPVRIVRTSGTTGGQKRFLMTRRMFDGMVVQRLFCWNLTRRSRYLADLPFTVATAHRFATAVLRAGGTVLFESRMPPWQAIARYGITDLQLLTQALAQIVEQLPPDFAKPAALSVTAIGGALPPMLRTAALARLASEAVDTYGANEVGMIASTASTGPAGVPLTLRPGALVEIVDDAGRPLPFGQAGEVRVRTEFMVSQYIDDPEASARMFRDGWFHPGDIGILHAPRRLEILGRRDEILNVGGLKYAPDALETLLRDAAAGEVAVSSIATAAGIEELCIVVTGALDAARHARILQAFRHLPPMRVHFATLPSLPRTETGKIRRAELRDTLRRMPRRG